MSNEYVSHLMDVSVAQICLAIGWTKAHNSSLQYLSQLTERYLRRLAELVKRFAELNNRTAPNMDDLAFGFNYLRIDLKQMVEYCENVKLPDSAQPHYCSYVSIPNGNKIKGIRE
uniref:Bromodomain associated domain-containing protein n=1 Tax=Anopheles culicifacies TaxID=139723 RepID=A0A182LUJ4_9DIPT